MRAGQRGGSLWCYNPYGAGAAIPFLLNSMVLRCSFFVMSNSEQFPRVICLLYCFYPHLFSQTRRGLCRAQ